MPYRHSVTWLVIFAVIAIMFLQLPHLAARQDAVLRTYAPLVEVDALAKQKYVEPVDGGQLVEGAIRGLLRELDPYSAYIAPAQLGAFEERNRGDFIGVGLELGLRSGRMTVIAPIEGGPAVKAGVLPGDVICTINGRETEGLSLFDVESALHASRDGAVHLRVEREGRSEPLAVTIHPGPVSLHTVRGYSRDDGGAWIFAIEQAPDIGYIRVSAFLENTMRDFDDALRAVRESGTAALVLDLRFNPGGLMTESVHMVDRFLGAGLILATVSRRKAEQEYFAEPAATDVEIPVAVLINGGSASAAEIVAGALQDHGRALVVGERSFGKGSVQRLIHLVESGGAVKLTTAYYRLPSGRFIHRMSDDTLSDDWGINPDVEVTLSPEEVDRLQAARRALDAPVIAGVDCGEFGRNGADRASRRLFLDAQLEAAIARLRTRMGSAGR